MKSNELNDAELDELREAYWNANAQDCQSEYEFYTLIPDAVIIDYYAGIEFCEDDFFCNIEN